MKTISTGVSQGPILYLLHTLDLPKCEELVIRTFPEYREYLDTCQLSTRRLDAVISVVSRVEYFSRVAK